jgi:DNA-binding beta-propeller fold protein YncE
MSLVSMSFNQARTRLVLSGAALAAVGFMVGCGGTARPVVTPIGSPGPPAQPSSLVAVVSSPGSNLPGIGTIIDYSGDTILAQQPIGVGPLAFSADSLGANGYTINTDGTLTNFPISASFQEKNVTYTTLPTGSLPTNLFSPSAGLWAVDQAGYNVDVFTGSPADFLLSVAVAPQPVAIIGAGSIGQHNFAISLNQRNAAQVIPYDTTCNTPGNFANLVANGEIGESDTIEVASHTVSNEIPLGVCPVYGLLSTDGQRLFVLNRGDDTITVINVRNNTLDECPQALVNNACPVTTNQNGQPITFHPALPLSLNAVAALNAKVPGSGNPPNGTTGMTQTAGPVYAEYNAATSQLVVADYDGGTISIIDVSLDEYGNDSATFGTTYTVPVGTNPASVTVLYDGSRAYTANQTDGTVSIVTLASHTVEKTLTVVGHPRTVVSTQNSTIGKVYAASPDSPYLTILRTDQDIVDTTMLVEGSIVDVRVSSQNATNSNNNNVSRMPGAGQPCNLPDTTNGYHVTGSTTKVEPTDSITNCQSQVLIAN